MLKPKTYRVLEMAVEAGVTRGYARAFKHNENPSSEEIQNSILTCVMDDVSGWFIFDDEM